MTVWHRDSLRMVVTGMVFLLGGYGAEARKTRKPERTPAEKKPPELALSGRINDIRFWSLGDATRIAVEVTSEYKLRSDRLQNPDRLFFDIVGVKPAGKKGIQTITVGDEFVKQIRVAETQPGTTRIVLDLASAVDFSASQLASPDRLIIELKPPPGARRSSPPPAQTAVVHRREFSPPPSRAAAGLSAAPLLEVPPRLTPRVDQPRIPTAKIDPPLPPGTLREATPRETRRETPAEMARAITPRMPAATPAAPAKKTTAGESSLTRVLGLKLGKIVIDAGHGGHDAGTRGPGGLLEKDLVLDIAKRLAALVESRMGSEVVMTRTDDTFVPLEQRPQIANEAKADLFISIHANSSPVKSVSGVETYYLNFTTSRTALEVAARENASSERSIHELQDLLQKIALKDKVEESREFAARVQLSLASLSTKTNADSKNRGVKKAPFIVLIGAAMPSILAEVGFVTNARDETLMRRPDYRQKIAEALYKGISQYASGLSHFQVAQRKPDNE